MGVLGENILDDVLTVDDYIERKLKRHEDKKVAKDLFVSLHTLERWKTKTGVKRHHVNQRRYSMIQKMISDNKKMSEIANELGISVRNCDYIRKKFSSEKSF